MFRLARGNEEARYQKWIARFDTLTDADFAAMKDEQSVFGKPPLLFVLVAVEDVGETTRDTVEARLQAQVYERWEVDFARAAVLDDWNRALRSASGDFVVAVHPDVTLRPHALFLFAQTIERNPNAVLIYGDDDVVDETGARSHHYFKPDWSEALFRCQNYLGGVVCFRRTSALAVGGFDDEDDDDYGWGLFLKISANTSPDTIHHLPFVLSHRPAEGPDDSERRQRVARALEKRLRRTAQDAQVEPVGEVSYRVRYALPERAPTLTIIVPSRCDPQVLNPCLEGLLKRTSYPELDVIVVTNAQQDDSRLARYLASIAIEPQVHVLFYDERPYNFSKTNNWAAEQARGDLFCFLNDDTEVIRGDWLATMVTQVLQDRVAAAGAKLIYPNGRIQHAGIVLGAGGVAAHAYRGSRNGICGYHDRAVVAQDVSCVTAACMLVRREAFNEVGGFDPALAIAYNDIDLCLRLRQRGWRIVWTPDADLYHKEAASLGPHYVGQTADQWASEFDLIRSRWGDELLSDPYYNPNLSLDALQLWEPAFPPRVSYPWRAR